MLDHPERGAADCPPALPHDRVVVSGQERKFYVAPIGATLGGLLHEGVFRDAVFAASFLFAFLFLPLFLLVAFLLLFLLLLVPFVDVVVSGSGADPRGANAVYYGSIL